MPSVTLNFGAGFLAAALLSGAAFASLIARSFRRVRGRLGAPLRRAVVDSSARLVSDVLSRTAVRSALADVIARGINEWMSGREAQEAIKAMVSGTTRGDVAREFGKELPGLAGNFGYGLAMGVVPEPLKRQGQAAVDERKAAMLGKKEDLKENRGRVVDLMTDRSGEDDTAGSESLLKED